MLNKNLLRLFVFACILGGFLLPVKNAGLAADARFEKLRLESAKIKTMQADFTQKKFMRILSRPLVSTGRFYYDAPDSFRWEYVTPLRSVVISRNNKTRRFIYSDGKMIEDKAGGAQAMQIVLNDVSGWISGRFDQNPSFSAAIAEDVNTTITLSPVGKNVAGFIQKIEIILSPKTAAVQSVKIVEDASTFTHIDFQNVQTNKIIDPAVFQDVR
jgi:outer membrane lipoprotein-sorting protein